MSSQIKAVNGKYLDAETVFSQALKYIKQRALAVTKKKFSVSSIDEIQWVLTVPAICKLPAVRSTLPFSQKKRGKSCVPLF